jgi:hypothetical protein
MVSSVIREGILEPYSGLYSGVVASMRKILLIAHTMHRDKTEYIAV